MFYNSNACGNLGNESSRVWLNTPNQNNTNTLNIGVNLKGFFKPYLNDFNNTLHTKSSNIINDCINNAGDSSYLIGVIAFGVFMICCMGCASERANKNDSDSDYYQEFDEESPSVFGNNRN